MNVAGLLLGRGDADAAAVIDSRGTCTYRELRERVVRTAAYLRRAGVQRGERVLLIAENGPFFVVAYLATLHAGGVVVPMTPLITPNDLRVIIESSSPRAVFIQARRLARLAETLAGVPVRIPDDASFEAIAAGPATTETDPTEAAAGDLAALMFTSGSTGKPRGVMLSHGNLAANTAAIAEYLELRATDRMMVVLPMHYCFGASLLHTHLSVGGSIVIDNRFMFPDKVLARLIETGCTGFAGVPSHFQILLRNSSMKTMHFPSLRRVQQAGGKLAETLVRELVEAVAPASLFVMYGQTEATARLSYLPPELLVSKAGSIGRGIPGVTLRVVGDDGAPVAPGAVGEIVAEGPSIASSYWRAEEESAATFRGGRLHTGDLARIDEDGYIFVVDRVKDMLKCGGVRTSSQAIESVLFEVSDVVEAAVIAVPDDVLGEAPCAFIVPRAAVDDSALEARLRSHCGARLATELIPKFFRIVQSFPKTSSGKLNKPALRLLLEHGSET